MRTSYYDVEHWATLYLIDLTWLPNEHAGWWVSDVTVNARFRGQGWGRKVMAECLADADAQGQTLWLAIVPSPPMTYEILQAWYERCGFVQVPHEWDDNVWRRLPSGSAP